MIKIKVTSFKENAVAEPIDSVYGSSSGSKTSRITFEGFKEDRYRVAAMKTKPFFSCFYIKITSDSQSYWVNKNSLKRRFASHHDVLNQFFPDIQPSPETVPSLASLRNGRLHAEISAVRDRADASSRDTISKYHLGALPPFPNAIGFDEGSISRHLAAATMHSDPKRRLQLIRSALLAYGYNEKNYPTIYKGLQKEIIKALCTMYRRKPCRGGSLGPIKDDKCPPCELREAVMAYNHQRGFKCQAAALRRRIYKPSSRVPKST